MEERFSHEFITWKHTTPVGIKVEEVFGMDSRSGNVWLQMAKQIYGEQGETGFREIDHFENGAPYLPDLKARISVTHTNHFFAVASLPKTPEIALDSFNPRSAMGIDAEPLDRNQVIKVRPKFLSENEQKMIPSDKVTENLIAWTSKEALYKAAFTPGLDFCTDLIILKLPQLDLNPSPIPEYSVGEAVIKFPDNTQQEMRLYSYQSYGCCVTIAFSPKCATFKKRM